MREVKALFLLDIIKFKNFVKDLITNPKRFFIYFLQFVWYLFLLIPIIVNKDKTFYQISTIKLSYLNAGIIAVMLLVVITSVNSSLKQPGILIEEGDTVFLLSSPIKERMVFLWYVIRAIFKNLILAILFILYLPFLSVTMEVNK
ncbi:putative ABC exporter domain-containing protein [Thermoanaerobacter mathranii]|uniref:putative ABC exporter domain-containing protein n=1 Tax=Thermoanaerobacter mathranii TaxID=583357 RepID=UPI0001B0BB5C|nr:putative ABC exporter domain-containing protein [Thermoanaerobacter mathranii]